MWESGPVGGDSAFIDPNGTFYSVEYATHWDFAYDRVSKLGYFPNEHGFVEYKGRHCSALDLLEKLGWMHVSDGDVVAHCKNDPTQSQLNTVLDWALAVGDTKFVCVKERLLKFLKVVE